MVIVLHDYHVYSCQGFHLGSWFLQVGGFWNANGLLELCSRIVAKLLYSCLCLFDTIIKLQVVDENNLFTAK